MRKPDLVLNGFNVYKCKGEGQGSCTRCNSLGIWNSNWMCFLYEIEGIDGCYCSNCASIVTYENKNKDH